METWRVFFTSDLPPGVRGATRWSDRTIWLRSGLSQVQRRCTVEHERQHALRGQEGHSPSEELHVRKATARALIPFDRLAAAVRWSRNVHELADELWVTPGVLMDRLRHLHPAERARLLEVLHDAHAA